MDDDARRMVTIAEAGSISEAARRLHVSQPALSNWLKKLESHVGTQLFDRGTAPLLPTYAGETYLAWASKAIESHNAMEKDLAAIASNAIRRLRIGTSVPRGSGMLPEVFELFYQRTDGCIAFVYEAGTPDSHNRMLASSEIDCAVLTPVFPESPLFSGEPICDERMIVIAPSAWDIAADDNGGPLPDIRLSSLERLPFVMPPRHLKHHYVVRSIMDAANVKLNVAFHSCSNEMTFEMVKRGQGASIAPNTFVFSQADSRLAFYGLGDIVRPRHLYYNRRTGSAVSHDEHFFIETLKAWIDRDPYLRPSAAYEP